MHDNISFNVGNCVKLKEFVKNDLWKEYRLNNDLEGYGTIDKVGPNDWVRVVFGATRKRFTTNKLNLIMENNWWIN